MNKEYKQISYDSLSDPGGRGINEDYLESLKIGDHYYFVLCDGLGGHGNGNIASHFVVDQVLGCVQQGMSVEDSILFAQNSLLEKQKIEQAEGSMKTTLTCLELSESDARFLHVGDSRIYLFEHHRYRLRSKDHSVPQMLVERGSIRDKDIRHHEDRSRLLRVMGTPWDYPKYQVVDGIRLHSDVSFLLCSDGFWELIDEKMMSRTLRKAKTPGDWLRSMENIVRKNGQGTNMDNYSAIAVFIR